MIHEDGEPLCDTPVNEKSQEKFWEDGGEEVGHHYFRVRDGTFIVLVKLDSDEYAYIMNQKRSIDIDMMDNFEIAEYMMKKENII